MSTVVAARRIDRLAPVATVTAVLIAWQLITTVGPVPGTLFPGPVQVADAAADYPLTQLSADVRASVLRLVSGFALAAVAGVALGAFAGSSTLVQRLLHAPLELLRPIPPLAWIAVAVIWLGLGEASKVFIIFVAAFFPIYVGSYRGVRSVDPTLVEASETLGVKRHSVIRRVLLPAASPDIATGLRVGWGLAFTALVGAEVIAAKSGLGYMVMNARATGDIAIIMYGILIIGTLGWISDAFIQWALMRRWLSWHFRDSQ